MRRSSALRSGWALSPTALRGREVVLGALDGRALLAQPRAQRVELLELPAHLGGVGDQGLEHTFVGDRRQLALAGRGAFSPEQGLEARRPRPERFDARERVGEVAVTGGGERLLGVEHRDVEVAQSRTTTAPRDR